jgi:hypothetical protein
MLESALTLLILGERGVKKATFEALKGALAVHDCGLCIRHDVESQVDNMSFLRFTVIGGMLGSDITKASVQAAHGGVEGSERRLSHTVLWFFTIFFPGGIDFGTWHWG